MANVLTVLRLVPDTQVENIKTFLTPIKKLCKEHQIEFMKYDKEPMSYGMFSILLYVKNPDSEEGAETLGTFQESLEGAGTLQSVEVHTQTLIDY